jgi:F-type H+-transporting ATPase subunit gamma
MATLRDIRKRIASVKNTQKITKAMKMVAAAKLRRAQTRLINARPYSTKMQQLLGEIVNLVEGEPHPAFDPREEVKTSEFLILTSDRGLCGGFNGTLLRRIEAFLKEKQKSVANVKISVIGRKGRDFFRARHREPDQLLTGIKEVLSFEEALKMANDFLAGFQEKKFDELYLVYNYFRSAISQEVRIEKILPLDRKAFPKREGFFPEYLYEPSRAEVLADLIPRAVATMIQRSLLESVAGEYSARMLAMDNATNNCVDMIFALTLQMNRIRQAAITTELMDIVNGAESLKK